MFIDSLSDQEIEAVIVAVKYWRHHRSDSDTRRNDPVLTPAAVDLLLAKLKSASSSMASAPPDELTTEHFW